MNAAPNDVDWISLPHLIQLATPLVSEATDRLDDWQRRGGARQLAWQKRRGKRQFATGDCVIFRRSYSGHRFKSGSFGVIGEVSPLHIKNGIPLGVRSGSLGVIEEVSPLRIGEFGPQRIMITLDSGHSIVVVEHGGLIEKISRRALNKILRITKDAIVRERGDAILQLILLYACAKLTQVDVPPVLQQFIDDLDLRVFAEEVPRAYLEGLLALDKLPRPGRPRKNTERDRRIVVSLMNETRTAGGTHNLACADVGASFKLSEERVRAIFKCASRELRADIAMELMEKNAIDPHHK